MSPEDAQPAVLENALRPMPATPTVIMIICYYYYYSCLSFWIDLYCSLGNKGGSRNGLRGAVSVAWWRTTLRTEIMKSKSPRSMCLHVGEEQCLGKCPTPLSPPERRRTRAWGRSHGRWWDLSSTTLHDILKCFLGRGKCLHGLGEGASGSGRPIVVHLLQIQGSRWTTRTLCTSSSSATSKKGDLLT